MIRYKVQLYRYDYYTEQTVYKTFIFKPGEPILIQRYNLEFIPAKELQVLTEGHSVVEWTAEEGKVWWKVESVEKITL